MDSTGVKIYYEIEGKGIDVIMIHGFASDMEINCKRCGVTDKLKTENRVVMVYCRGHGKSDKPKNPQMYGQKMMDDILNLMDHLGIEKANFVGYSMGAEIALSLLLEHSERFKSVVLGGFGLPAILGQNHSGSSVPSDYSPVVKALLADNMEQVTDPVSRVFRQYAELTGGDLKALAAVMMGIIEHELEWNKDLEAIWGKVREIRVPLMTIVGNDDNILPTDNKMGLAMAVPDGCHFQIQGKNHINVATDPKFSIAIRAFLNYVNG